MIFRQFSAFSGFSLHGNPILQLMSLDLDSSSNFTSIIVVRIFFFFISFPFGIIEETQDAKMPKIRFSQGGLPLFPQTWVFRHFCILCFSIIQK